MDFRIADTFTDSLNVVAACAGRWKSVKMDGQAQVEVWRNDWDQRP